MDLSPWRKAKSARMGALVLLVALVVPFLATGCGPQSPEDAVRSFFGAIEDQNWNAYLDSVLPDNVRRMSETDLAARKDEFGKADFQYKDLKFNTKYDKANKNKADVELVSGKIVGKNPSTGKTETTTIAEIKKTYGEIPSYKTEKFKGRWYVDIPLASADRPQEQTL